MSPSSSFESHLEAELERLERAGLRRSLRRVVPSPSAKAAIETKTVLNFASNDYLGLATHPALIEAACEAAARHGAGSGASRLVTGTLPEHLDLEAAIAQFKNAAAALTFSSGYAAALGTLPALAGPGDALWLDKLCHACLIDAARLSGAVLRVFPHNDLGVLDRRLEAFRAKSPKTCL
ncbi:MAG: aminotransferase class I/II-fold pyridoxal phosphate-dependent enzyme, partial [Terrimicrobiaceae bacterium]|nr:aminotransferase class I/II-fold pyridoxal phosphate-dependent enzyme [Terrimicrobiaceae bacterium]